MARKTPGKNISYIAYSPNEACDVDPRRQQAILETRQGYIDMQQRVTKHRKNRIYKESFAKRKRLDLLKPVACYGYEAYEVKKYSGVSMGELLYGDPKYDKIQVNEPDGSQIMLVRGKQNEFYRPGTPEKNQTMANRYRFFYGEVLIPLGVSSPEAQPYQGEIASPNPIHVEQGPPSAEIMKKYGHFIKEYRNGLNGVLCYRLKKQKKTLGQLIDPKVDYLWMTPANRPDQPRRVVRPKGGNEFYYDVRDKYGYLVGAKIDIKGDEYLYFVDPERRPMEIATAPAPEVTPSKPDNMLKKYPTLFSGVYRGVKGLNCYQLKQTKKAIGNIIDPKVDYLWYAPASHPNVPVRLVRPQGGNDFYYDVRDNQGYLIGNKVKAVKGDFIYFDDPEVRPQYVSAAPSATIPFTPVITVPQGGVQPAPSPSPAPSSTPSPAPVSTPAPSPSSTQSTPETINKEKIKPEEIKKWIDPRNNIQKLTFKGKANKKQLKETLIKFKNIIVVVSIRSADTIIKSMEMKVEGDKLYILRKDYSPSVGRAENKQEFDLKNKKILKNWRRFYPKKNKPSGSFLDNVNLSFEKNAEASLVRSELKIPKNIKVSFVGRLSDSKKAKMVRILKKFKSSITKVSLKGGKVLRIDVSLKGNIITVSRTEKSAAVEKNIYTMKFDIGTGERHSEPPPIVISR